DGLSPGSQHHIELLDGDTLLEATTFRTPPAPSQKGQVHIVAGSCSDMSKNADVAAFSTMAAADPPADFAVFLGDNCYYVNQGRTTSGGSAPRDWESTVRMLLRQVQARNHPEFHKVSSRLAAFSTWD